MEDMVPAPWPEVCEFRPPHPRSPPPPPARHPGAEVAEEILTGSRLWGPGRVFARPHSVNRVEGDAEHLERLRLQTGLRGRPCHAPGGKGDPSSKWSRQKKSRSRPLQPPRPSHHRRHRKKPHRPKRPSHHRRHQDLSKYGQRWSKLSYTSINAQQRHQTRLIWRKITQFGKNQIAKQDSNQIKTMAVRN